MQIIQALNDRNLFGETFRGSSWAAWKGSILKPLFGLPMNAKEHQLYTEISGRTEPPSNPAQEAYIVAGRRSGKSTVAAAIGVFAAIARDYRPFLSPGSLATIFIVSPDRTQSRIVFRTVRGLLEQSPMLKDRIVRSTETAIELIDQVAIEVGTASARTLRGYSCPLVILDELAFFDQGAEAADADEAVIQALLPSLATIPRSMLLGISSPYARRGVLWDRYDRHWGKNDAVQIYRAATRMLNPTLPQSIVDEAMQKDPQAAGAEWFALFRQDRDTYVSREIVNQCVTRGVTERAPQSTLRYVAFCDPAGGAGADAMALAIAHGTRDGCAVLDCTVTRKPPFSPEAVVGEFAMWLKKYSITTVRGDHFGGSFLVEAFRKHGINYVIHGEPKRVLFQTFLPMMTSGKAELLDLPPLLNQLVALERQVSRGGTETITHPIGGHDDVAVAAAGALVTAAAASGGLSRAIFLAAPPVIGGGAVRPDLAIPSDGGGGIVLEDMPAGMMSDRRFDDVFSR